MQSILCSVRFDDICESMDWGQFNKAIELMDKYNIKPLLGVVPQNKDLHLMKGDYNHSFWDIIKDLQNRGYAIAMHGYVHVYDIKSRGIVNLGCDSEFAGHSYDVQFEKIKKGKEILERHGIKTDIFFAPSHSYDKNTLRALRDNGFKYLSDGKSSKPYIQEGIKCIPCRFFGTPKYIKKGFNISVCHSSNWNEYPNNYFQLVEFCTKNKEQLIDFNELIKVPEGNFIFQKITEKLYIILYDYIRLKLSNIKIINKIYHKIYK